MAKTLEELKQELESRKVPKITKQEITEYNSKPEVQERGVKLVETKKDNYKNILLGILGVAVICLAILTYLAYQGDLKLTGDINIPDCPAAPAVPACNCPSITIPPCPANSCNVNLTCPSMNNLTIRMVNST